MGQTIQRHKKLFAGVFLFIVMFSFLGSCCKAEINEEYGNNNEVYEASLEKKMEQSVLWDAIAQLIYGVGSLIEWLVGGAMGQLTGSSAFPWADRIIFNTMPMLDINFLNPSKGSMFLADDGTQEGKEIVLSKIVKNVYYTVLSLAVGFLGVAVGIMAIRLAISSIAAEKAKYKEAIMNWLLGIVMLFTMHFILSFVFYTNEKMVEIASKILKDSLNTIEEEIPPINNLSAYEKITQNFINKQMSAGFLKSSNFNNSHSSQYTPGPHADNNMDATACMDGILKFLGCNYDSRAALMAHAVNMDGYTDPIAYSNSRNVVIVGKLLSNSTYRDIQLFRANGGTSYSGDWWDFAFSKAENAGGVTRTLYNDLYLLFNGLPSPDSSGVYNTGKDAGEDWTSKEHKNYQQTVHDILERTDKGTPQDVSSNNVGNAESGIQIIADMGEYFKESAWTYETDSGGNATGWVANKLTLGRSHTLRNFYYSIINVFCSVY